MAPNEDAALEEFQCPHQKTRMTNNETLMTLNTKNATAIPHATPDVMRYRITETIAMHMDTLSTANTAAGDALPLLQGMQRPPKTNLTVGATDSMNVS